MSATTGRRLEQTVLRLEALGDVGILALSKEIGVFRTKLERRLSRLWYLRWITRIWLVAGFLFFTTWLYRNVELDSGIGIEAKNWNEIVSFAADLVELNFLLLPIVVSLFLIERWIERAAIRTMLSQLDLFTDQIYDEQFDDNPYHCSGITKATGNEWLLECLDCCAALLSVVRMLAQRVTESTGDGTIMEQSGLVRRNAGDNHTRILIKIGILKTSQGVSIPALTTQFRYEG